MIFVLIHLQTSRLKNKFKLTINCRRQKVMNSTFKEVRLKSIQSLSHKLILKLKSILLENSQTHSKKLN